MCVCLHMYSALLMMPVQDYSMVLDFRIWFLFVTISIYVLLLSPYMRKQREIHKTLRQTYLCIKHQNYITKMPDPYS